MSEPVALSSRMRPLVEADLAQLLVWRNHPEVRRYMYTQHEISQDEHWHWFERGSSDPHKHLLIFESGGQALGYVGFHELGDGGIADWGFYAAPGAPRGSGRQMGHAALVHAFTQLKLHKVCGQALTYNQRSIHFHQALGFLQEGILRDHRFDGEQYHHVMCFGLLSHEWQPKPKGQREKTC